MFLGVLGVPQLSLLDLVLSGKEAGIEVGRLLDGKAKLELELYQPNTRLFFGSVLPTLVETPKVLSKDHPRMPAMLGLCNFSLSELYEYGIPVYQGGDSNFTTLDLREITKVFCEVERKSLKVNRQFDLGKNIMQSVIKDSFLQRLQSFLYRIRDPEERKRVQKEVYLHLRGTKKRVCLPPYLEDLMKSELAIRFAKAVTAASNGVDIDEVAESFNIDRFEIAFALAKTKV